MNLDKMKTHKDTRGPPRGLLSLKIPMIQSRIYKEKKPTIPIVPGKFKTRGGGCLIQEAREKMTTDFGAANQPGKFDDDNKFTSETRTGQDWILPRQEPKNLDSNCANIVALPVVLGKFKTRGGGCLVQESRAKAMYKMKMHKDTRGPPRDLIFERPMIRSRIYKEKKSTIPIVPGKFKTRGGGCLIQEAREKMTTDFGAANQPGKFDDDNKFTSETRTGQDWILPRQEPKNLDSNCADIVARPIVLGKFETRGGGCSVQESRARYRMKTLGLEIPFIHSRMYKEMKSTIPIVPGKFKTRGGGCLVQESRAEARENMKTDFGAANQPGKFDRGRRGRSFISLVRDFEQN